MSINDLAGVEEVVIEDVVEDSLGGEQEQSKFRFALPEWLWIKRKTDPIENYMQHPFNFKHSEGVAYIIRGFAAIGGELIDYWWTDVLGGFLRLRTEGKGGESK